MLRLFVDMDRKLTHPQLKLLLDDILDLDCGFIFFLSFSVSARFGAAPIHVYT